MFIYRKSFKHLQINIRTRTSLSTSRTWIQEKIIEHSSFSRSDNFFKSQFHRFFMLYCRSLLYNILARITCSSIECFCSGSISRQFFRTWLNNGSVLEKLFILFSKSSGFKLSLTWRFFLNNWYRFQGIASAVEWNLVKFSQYIL